MNKLFLKVIFIFSLLAVPAFAQQPSQTIHLKDGTTIKGQLINITNGFYTIASPTMGQVKVSSDQVLSINSAEAAGGTVKVTSDANGKISAETVNEVKTNMMQDPQIMSLIQELIKDPEVAELMKNPSLIQDAMSMDPQKIQNNPDVQKLMQNSTMQEIIRITAGQLQNSQK